jgi:hypothetical protein
MQLNINMNARAVGRVLRWKLSLMVISLSYASERLIDLQHVMGYAHPAAARLEHTPCRDLQHQNTLEEFLTTTKEDMFPLIRILLHTGFTISNQLQYINNYQYINKLFLTFSSK